VIPDHPLQLVVPVRAFCRKRRAWGPVRFRGRCPAPLDRQRRWTVALVNQRDERPGAASPPLPGRPRPREWRERLGPLPARRWPASRGSGCPSPSNNTTRRMLHRLRAKAMATWEAATANNQPGRTDCVSDVANLTALNLTDDLEPALELLRNALR